VVIAVDGRLGGGYDVVEDLPESLGGGEFAAVFEVVFPGDVVGFGAGVVVPEGPVAVEGEAGDCGEGFVV